MAEVPSVGMAVADFVFRVHGIPSRAEKYRARALETVVGGPAANAAIAVARLGGRAVLVTRPGEDAIADTVRAGLEAEGVACRIRRRGRSPVSAAMLDLCMFAEGSHWQETIAITGDRARIEARVPGPARLSASGEERAAELSVADRTRRVETREEVPVDRRILRAGDHHGATFFQHERFRRLAAAGSGDAEVGLADGYWSVRVGEAAEESARIGAPVDLRGRGP